MSVSNDLSMNQIGFNSFEFFHPTKPNFRIGLGKFFPIDQISHKHRVHCVCVHVDRVVITGAISFYQIDANLRNNLKISPLSLKKFSTAKKIDFYFKHFHRAIYDPLSALPTPIEFQTEEVCIKLIENNPLNITALHPSAFTQTICDLTVNLYPEAIILFPQRFLSERLICEAVSKKGLLLSSIPRELRTARICHAAIAQNPMTILETPEEFLDVEICLSVLRKNQNIFFFLPQNLKTPETTLLVNLKSPLLGPHFFQQKSLEEQDWITSTLANWFIADPSYHRELVLKLKDTLLINTTISKAVEKAPLPGELAHQILKYRNAEIQLKLLEISLSNHQVRTEAFKNAIITGTKPTSILPLLLIYVLSPTPEELANLKSFFHRFRAPIKDQATNLLRKILEFSLSINKLDISPREKIKLLSMTFLTSSTVDDLKLRISLVSVHLKFDHEFFCSVSRNMTTEFLKDFSIRFFSSLGIVDSTIPNFSERFFEKFILNARNPDAIFSYASNFLHNPLMLSHIRAFISLVLTDNFKPLRNLYNSHIHVLNPEQRKFWEQGSEETFKLMVLPAEFNPKTFLINKIIQDQHAKELIDSAKRIFFSPEGEISFRSEIEKCLSDLFHSRPENYLISLKELKRTLANSPQFAEILFLKDLDDQIALLERVDSLSKTLTLQDTEDYQDLLLCGTDILGSCQSVYGHPEYNKCLLGYLLDGKIRLLALKDSKGKIESRAILKILLDHNSQPALFIERAYPDERYKQFFIDLALKKAKKMNIQLYKAYVSGESQMLVSLGSRAPFEYEDGAQIGMGVNNGKYAIFANLVSSP